MSCLRLMPMSRPTRPADAIDAGAKSLTSTLVMQSISSD